MAVTPDLILGILRDYLQTALETGVITLVSTGRGNARADSSANEQLIGNSLRAFALGHPLFTQGGFTFDITINGQWYDFLVKSADDSIWLPINLKVSALRGNDNLSSKAGLFYALTGVRPSNTLIRNWDLFCQNMAVRIRRTDCLADYYFLVVRKDGGNAPAERVFWTSLLQLQCVKPNGSNPPFQCRWRDNMVRATRARPEAVDNLLDVVGETFVLRAQALDSFKQHVAPGFSDALRTKWSGETPEVEGEAG
jgi:hypothetical protein